MQELGVWTTSSGTSEAFLELEADQDVPATELPSWVSSALKGAVAGAATGAAGGPVGALIGAATGGALGAASSAAAPASAASSASPIAKPPADNSRAAIVQALQQFATVLPALVQVLSASKPGGKESIGEVNESRDGADASEWGPESFQGTWTVP
jgi:hypothetical protein